VKRVKSKQSRVVDAVGGTGVPTVTLYCTVRKGMTVDDKLERMTGQSSADFTAFLGLFIAINTARLQQKKITSAAQKFCLFWLQNCTQD
jgi:hypothetical protein